MKNELFFNVEKTDTGKTFNRTEKETDELTNKKREYIKDAIESVTNDRQLILQIQEALENKIGDKHSEGYQTQYPDAWEENKDKFIGDFNLPVSMGGVEGEEKIDAESKIWSENMWRFDYEEFLKRSLTEEVTKKLYSDHVGEHNRDKDNNELYEDLRNEYDSKLIEDTIRDEMHGVYENCRSILFEEDEHK